MGMLLGSLGFLGFCFCLVWLIVRAVRRKPLKRQALGLLACFALFIVGVAVTPPSDTAGGRTGETHETPRIDVESLKRGSSDTAEAAEPEAVPETEPAAEPEAVPEAEPVEEPEPAPEVETVPETETAEDTKLLTLEECMETIRTTANSTYGEGNYTIKLENDGAVLSFCPSVQGTALGVVLAQAGNEEYIAEWNTMVSSIVSSTKAMQDFLNNNGHKNTIVITNVMNDANQENYLLCVSLGTVLYDAVNGINLLGD